MTTTPRIAFTDSQTFLHCSRAHQLYFLKLCVQYASRYSPRNYIDDIATWCTFCDNVFLLYNLSISASSQLLQTVVNSSHRKISPWPGLSWFELSWGRLRLTDTVKRENEMHEKALIFLSDFLAAFIFRQTILKVINLRVGDDSPRYQCMHPLTDQKQQILSCDRSVAYLLGTSAEVKGHGANRKLMGGFLSDLLWVQRRMSHHFRAVLQCDLSIWYNRHYYVFCYNVVHEAPRCIWCLLK